MEEAKRKQIEAKLYQMIVQADQAKNEKSPVNRKSFGVTVIRRRKGNPDLHIARENVWNPSDLRPAGNVEIGFLTEI